MKLLVVYKLIPFDFDFQLFNLLIYLTVGIGEALFMNDNDNNCRFFDKKK